MPNIISKGGTVNITTNLNLYGKTEASGATISAITQPNTFSSYGMAGINASSAITLTHRESNSVIINTAVSSMVINIPSGLPNGFTFGALAETGPIRINPIGQNRIYLPLSGVLKSAGQNVFLQGSGTFAIFTHVSGIFYPMVNGYMT